MNLIEIHFTDTEMGYEHIIMSNDGEALIATLKQGFRYEELLKARVIKYSDLRDSKYYKT